MMKNTFCPVVPCPIVPLSRLSLSDMMCTQTLMCTFLLKSALTLRKISYICSRFQKPNNYEHKVSDTL